MLLHKVDDRPGIRQNGERLKPLILNEVDRIAAVAVQRIDAMFNFVAEQQCFGFDAELRGEFATLADEFKAHIGDFPGFLLDENPDISHFFRHDVLTPECDR